MGAHIVKGQFQSDKYPTCPPGKVPLSVKDSTAQDLLWTYAQRRREVDAEFSEDLETALRAAGYEPIHTKGVSDGCKHAPQTLGLDIASIGDAEGIAALVGLDAPTDGGDPC